MNTIEWLQLPEPTLTIEDNAGTIIKMCKKKSSLSSPPQSKLLNICHRTLPNLPRPQLTQAQLSPCTFFIYLKSKNEAFDPSLQEFCLEKPIVVINGLVEILNLDLSLFSTPTILDTKPNNSIEVRIQMHQPSEENWDQTYSKKVWNCYSHRTLSTIREYSTYQVTKLDESIKEGTEMSNNNEMTFNQLNLNSRRMIGRRNKEKLRFGTNVDLSNMKDWKPQLQELKKLPPLFRVESDVNMLNYVDHNIYGMNTVQLYMKVPGCRTPGHQENNNFCSVNINIGPNDCEWFAVSYEYWDAICSLCQRNNIDYLKDSWWPPSLKDLFDENIPVYRFYQKPGDLVWVNVGCVHWVQSIGFCNNIAWNVGPFTVEQYQGAIERYEWNKLHKFQSIVPMVHLSWNLARNVKVLDAQLYKLIKNCMLLTLGQYCLTLEFVKNMDVEMENFVTNKTKNVIYCEKCTIEIFGISLIRYDKKSPVPYCLDCALELSPLLEGFTYMDQNDINDLKNVYDNFQLLIFAALCLDIDSARKYIYTINSNKMDKQENFKNFHVFEKEEGLNENLLKKHLLTSFKHQACVETPPLISRQPLMREQLFPSSPFVRLTHRNEAFEPWLEEVCLDNPVVVIHNLTELINFNNEIFYPNSIAAKYSKRLEMRTQIQQISKENWDITYSKNIWNCYSHRHYMTIEKFNKYYSEKYNESAKEAKTYMENNPEEKNLQKAIHIVENPKKGRIHFATNLDLSNLTKWKRQLQELKKLPSFLQVDSNKNMLSYIGHNILGINTAQLYIKVPGSRITAHQENNNLSLVNINLGPGNCEWFVVPHEYWDKLFSLCQRNGVNFLIDSWWPSHVDELYKANIPIHRCIQRQGDVIWVNAGCVHWVQAGGYCTNIAWNVAPFTAKQYKLAIQSYEWYKLQSFQSIVPMNHLSWNLARNTKISDPELYRLIKENIQQLLKHYNVILKFVKNKSMKPSKRSWEEKVHYCCKCGIELSHILLINEQRKNYAPHCLDCVLKHSPSLEGFSYMEQYDIKELMEICHNFTLNQSKSICSS
ncbi:uncharacterized protein LOC114937466 [Nylanderia fulva]|uniref:uncharacterized protein LOC114937466 n=1 Tax=Nylanderia fulva TaxID=613905 RepID=UPI0010FBAEB5|nr:uncharacterized protein LOC114937466 [Nylanderia fulva]